MTRDGRLPDELLVSADSHVTETPALWRDVLPESFFGRATSLGETRGVDPALRIGEMEQDGVVAEVLYPTLGLKIFSVEDVERHEEACFVYNRWLLDYCSVDPERLIGIALIPCYRPEVAIEELRYCQSRGMRGALVWQAPHPDLPFSGFHYDPIWRVAEELRMPLHVHILTGFNYTSRPNWNTGGAQAAAAGEDVRIAHMNHYRGSVNEKLTCTADQLFTFLFGGVFERFPRLKLVIVENEISWLPFYLDQWDYYYRRFLAVDPTDMTKEPSKYVEEQVLATFFRDPWAGRLLRWWGEDTVMWSNDFPHANSTWPHSREYVAQQLGDLDPSTRDKVLRTNCLQLYDIKAEALSNSL